MSINYTGLRHTADGKRISERLLRLREHALEQVRANRSADGLLLATWNLRDFDGPKFGWAPRTDEAFYYIAEIISGFDLVAIQEVKQDLSPFERLMRILGPSEWDYLLTDANRGGSGNGERMAFVFRRSKVWFRKVAGEVVLPTGQEIVDPAEVDPKKVAQPAALAAAAAAPAIEDAAAAEGSDEPRRLQFARSPYLVAFQCGWFHFSLCTVHIYYGEDSGPQLQRRIREIDALVRHFANKQDDEIADVRKARKDAGIPVEDAGRDPGVENYILLGDFNVVSPEHQTMQALVNHGFSVPPPIDRDALDASMRDHFYDQIAVRIKDDRYRVTAGGVVHMFNDVFTDDDFEYYKSVLPARDPEPNKKYRATTPQAIYEKWRSWQMSDHSPLWVRIETDFTDAYLQGIADAK